MKLMQTNNLELPSFFKYLPNAFVFSAYANHIYNGAQTYNQINFFFLHPNIAVCNKSDLLFLYFFFCSQRN